MNDEFIFTEEEAILITIENGYDGLEFNTSVWIKRGCLQPDRTMNALLDKLNTIFNYVEVTGKGKKRRYILKDKKVDVSERIFNYKGTIPTVQDEIMKEYIFNMIINLNFKVPLSYRKWALYFNMPDIEKYDIDEMIKEIKYTYHQYRVLYNSKKIVNIFNRTIDIRNKNIIENSFKWLQNENRIEVEEICNVKYMNGVFKEIDPIEYNFILDDIRTILEPLGTTYYSYSQALNSFYKSNKMINAINEVREHLANEYNIDYIFKTFYVTVTDPFIYDTYKHSEFIKAYYKRLIDLTIKRQAKQSYINSLSFWQRFYKLNTFILLKYLGVSEVETFIKEEKENLLENIDMYQLEYDMHLEEENNKKRGKWGNSKPLI